MTYLNIIAILGAGGFISAIFRLYLPRSQGRLASGIGLLIVMALALPRIASTDPSILQLFGVSGFLYAFLAWNRGRKTGLKSSAKAAMAVISAFILSLTLTLTVPPAQGFYNLTYPDPHLLGDSAPPLENIGHDWEYWIPAWKNVQAHPRIFFQKWRANVNRMVFDFPYTHSAGHPASTGTGNAALPSALILFLTGLVIFPWIKGYRYIPPEISLVFILSLLGIGLRSFFSAGAEALLPWTPPLVIVILVIFNSSITIKVRLENSEINQA